jgi:hypothetical protein
MRRIAAKVHGGDLQIRRGLEMLRGSDRIAPGLGKTALTIFCAGLSATIFAAPLWAAEGTAPAAVGATASPATTGSINPAGAPEEADTPTLPPPAVTSGPPMPIAIELNAVAQVDKTCRLSFRIRNTLKVSVKDMAMELVLFDGDGMTERFVVVRTGEVPAGRSRVRQYDMPNLDCDILGSALLNDVSECDGDGLTPEVCLDKISVASRTYATFEY